MPNKKDQRIIRGIPEDDYWRLVALLGDRQKADDIIEHENRNYRGIVMLIYELELKRLLKTNPIAKFLVILILVAIIVYIIQYFFFFDPFIL